MTTTQPTCEQAIHKALARMYTMPTDSGWALRHDRAWNEPISPHERAIRDMIVSLASYADTYPVTFESDIASDGFLGEAWLDMLRGVRTLLNGELGRFDGGTLDSMICGIYEAAGFEGEL